MPEYCICKWLIFFLNIVLAAFMFHKVLTFTCKVHINVTSQVLHSCKSQIVNNHWLLTIHFELNTSSLVTGMRLFLCPWLAVPSQNYNSSCSQSSAPINWLGNKTRGCTNQLSEKAGRNVTRSFTGSLGKQDGAIADESAPSSSLLTSCAKEQWWERGSVASSHHCQLQGQKNTGNSPKCFSMASPGPHLTLVPPAGPGRSSLAAVVGRARAARSCPDGPRGAPATLREPPACAAPWHSFSIAESG